MKKMNTLQFYAAAVCFFSAAVLTIGGGSAVYSVVKIISPEMAIRGNDFNAHQNNRSFAQWYENRNRYMMPSYIPPAVADELQDKGIDGIPQSGGSATKLPDNEEELTALRKESYAGLVAAKKHDAKMGLIETLITVLLAAFLFVIHWKMLKKSQNDSE